MPQTKQFLGITAEQVQEIGTYLVSRPFHEVEKYVSILRQLPQINVVETPTATEKPIDPAQLEIPFTEVLGEDTPVENLKPQA